MLPSGSFIQQIKKKKRRRSFDMGLLKAFKYKGKKEKAKDNLIKLLEEINQEMGMNATENDSEDMQSQDTIKRLQNQMKMPITLGGPTSATKGKSDI